MRQDRISLTLFVCCVVVGTVPVAGSICTNIAVGGTNINALTWNFGIQDSGNGTTIYDGYLNSAGPSYFGRFAYVNNAIMGSYFPYRINGVPLIGGKNLTKSNPDLFVPTANFTCDSDYSGVWGPSYPDFRDNDNATRGRFQNLEAYVHYSAPNETSYIRSILYVRNIGSAVERVRITGSWYSNFFGVDLSPVANEGRYYTMFPFQDGDLGQDGDNTVVSNFGNFVESIHVRDLNADQLSMIRNWGGCEVILAPSVNVTVNPPLQCSSSGVSTDFTVSTTTARTDFTSGFTHRVVSLMDEEVVVAQSSSTVSVPNGVGSVKHQLWYRDCLLKETSFTACNSSTNVPSSPQSPSPQSNLPTTTKTPSAKVSSASSTSIGIAILSGFTVLGMLSNSKRLVQSSGLVIFLSLVLLVNVSFAQSTCTNVEIGDIGNPISWEFGLKDGGGAPAYRGALKYSSWTTFDVYAEMQNSLYSAFFNYWINSVPVLGGKNHSSFEPDAFVPTATFTCDGEYSGLWGPSYPDFRSEDLTQRARFPNIEVYIHFSAPNETSYLRSILYVKNTGSTSERVRIASDAASLMYTTDISPLNGGRYYTMFPFQEGDLGMNGDNPASRFDANVASLHAAGPRGRDAKISQVVAELDLGTVSPLYYTTLAPGQEFAVMFVVSFGVNRTLALKKAAEIDSEPAHLFHNLSTDQLSMIRNWGGCEVILAPSVSVTVNPPLQCSSSGVSTDFTVSTTTARTDFTSGFAHRVVSSNGREIVALQSSSTISVPNGVGSVKHQLWYRECLVKETMFDAC